MPRAFFDSPIKMMVLDEFYGYVLRYGTYEIQGVHKPCVYVSRDDQPNTIEIPIDPEVDLIRELK